MTIKSSFNFDDEFIIAFDKIITYRLINKSGSTNMLVIKQQGAVNNSEIQITTEKYNDFKKSYADFLDYKMKNAIEDNQLISYFLQEKENLFNEIRNNFKSLEEEFRQDYQEKMISFNENNKEVFTEIQNNFENVISKVKRTHDNLDTEYQKLSKVNRIFENFDVDSLLDTEVREGELLD